MQSEQRMSGSTRVQVWRLPRGAPRCELVMGFTWQHVELVLWLRCIRVCISQEDCDMYSELRDRSGIYICFTPISIAMSCVLMLAK